MATISFEVPDEVVRKFQKPNHAARDAYGYEQVAADNRSLPYERITAAAKAAVLRFELPWEPSEQDVDAYCEAHGWQVDRDMNQEDARDQLRKARARGWDATPRRLGGASG